MKLKRVKVHNFGKLNDCEITFDEGINLIYGANESGKTTLHEFIKGMFYGITRQRGRAARNDLYTRYEPWENSSYYAGSLSFESGGKDFRITRNFYKNDIKEEFICETDGERLSVEDGDMEVLLGDVSETVFDNTISIGQMKSRTDESLYQELRNYMTNYEGSGDWELDLQSAFASLKKQKKEYEGQQRLEKVQQDAREKELQMQMQYFQNELTTYNDKMQAIDEEIAEKQEEWQIIEAISNKKFKEEVEAVCIKSNNTCIKATALIMLFMMIPLLLKICEGILPPALKGELVMSLLACWHLFLAVMILALFAIVLMRYRQMVEIRKDVKVDQTALEYEQVISQVDVQMIVAEALKELIWKREQLAEMYEEKKIQLDNCQMDYWEYSTCGKEGEGLKGEIAALQLAIDGIGEISANKTKRMEKEFHKRISDILKDITKGRYDRVVLADNHEIALYNTEKYIPLWTLSKGTIEQVYFALRMAAAELFCGEDMPVLLDDVFAMYDEERLAAVLEWLARNKKQVIIFTCSTREGEVADYLKLNINKIKL